MDRSPLARFDHTELICLVDVDADAGHGDSSPGFHVLLQDVPGIHAVDVVCSEHTDVIRLLVAHDIEILDTVSAEPANHWRPLRICAGTVVT